MQTSMGSEFGANFSTIRIHTGTEAVHMSQDIGAQAFTHGSDIYFNEGKYDTNSNSGKHLLAHELTHTVQQGSAKPTIQKEDLGEHNYEESELSIPENSELGVDPDNPILENEVGSDELTDIISEFENEDFELKVKKSEPNLFIVPGEISREGISKKLTGESDHIRDFDYEVTDILETVDGVRQKAIKMRNYALLVDQAYGILRTKMDQKLEDDLNWSINKLKEASIDGQDEWLLVDRCLRWSQYSNILDTNGVQYFDKYLNGLASHSLTESNFLTSDTTKNGLDWLLTETEEKGEQVRKAIELRSSKWTTHYDYEATDGTGVLERGSVVGRYYWSDANSGIQLRVVNMIAYSETMDKVERLARNNPYQGRKVVIPGGDGKFYAYSLSIPHLDPLVDEPQEDPGGHFYWYYPDTIYVREREFRADVLDEDPEAQEHRREILSELLNNADENPAILLGIDYAVLATATFEERKKIFDYVLKTEIKSIPLAPDLLARVIYTTPNNEFMQLERHLSDQGLLAAMLTTGDTSQMILGQAFTQKSISAVPIGAQTLLNMPTFTIGKEDDTHHMYDVPTQQESSNIISEDEWVPTERPTLGREPAMAGEESAEINRSTIRFRPVTMEFHARYFPTTETGAETRSFLPTELIQLEILGSQPETRIVSAMELALIASVDNMDLLFEGIMRIGELWALRGAGVGIGRALGPAFTRGLAAGGLRAALTAAATEAGTEAGRQAVKRFLIEILIIGSTAVVNSNRDELKKTPQGRAFVAVFDVAMLALAARDIYRIARSGVLTEVVNKGRLAIASLTGRAKTRLINSLDDLAAAEIAAKRALERGWVAETAGGPGLSLIPGKEEALSNVFYSVRADLASSRVLTGLSGSAKTTAQSLFTRLKNLASGNSEMTRAYSAIARKADAMSATNAQSFLREVEQVLAATPRNKVNLAGFLWASTRSANPIAFLADVKWVLGLSGISDDAIRVLSKKAAARSVDLTWLRTTTLHIDDLNVLAADPMTPWRLFQRASTGNRGYWVTLWARVKIRGVSGELTGRSALLRQLPGHRVTSAQKRMGNSIIDYEVMAGQIQKGMEVKGWTVGVWERALLAFENRANGVALSWRQTRQIEKMDHLIKQINDIRTFTSQTPILAVSDVVRGGIRSRLTAILRTETGGSVRLVTMSETDIVNVGRRLRAAMGIR
ncbi:DUF4157 domain-containing protein [Tamlana agarivorans]|uniref:DUF4157 domain-containing protein n=1 Tax=Pseudotamlana agarivorans TaxID=481183 RepID=A0ACC5U7B0_9FLAO|nr:DUF4157 domain-containing protein [Tamlana agarivorans]MBU2950203.1 DUF4157 domain-containing protein [Tamlana agarivorans]